MFLWAPIFIFFNLKQEQSMKSIKGHRFQYGQSYISFKYEKAMHDLIRKIIHFTFLKQARKIKRFMVTLKKIPSRGILEYLHKVAWNDKKKKDVQRDNDSFSHATLPPEIRT